MFRLYKRDETGRVIAYHEAWAEPRRRRIVEHWGALGDAGQTEVHRIWIFRSLEQQFEAILGPARGIGFGVLEPGDYQTLTISYGPETNIEADQAADRINEILGWTGLGYCEDDAADAEGLSIICRVVDFDMAQTALSDALAGSDFDGYSHIAQD
ncbi:MAG: hypothetical protein AAGB16_06245 [Pseudomonadota bacterium]